MAIHAHITARLTRNSELKSIGDNQVLNFAIATDHGYGDKKTTVFLNCSLFGKRGASLANYLTKGTQIVVHGEVYTREYQAKDGTTKTSLECRVNEVDLVGSKKDNEKSEDSGSYKSNGKNPGEPFDDSLDTPF
jgi:single-strand DNA-binding protein